jgi:hypothetical protein
VDGLGLPTVLLVAGKAVVVMVAAAVEVAAVAMLEEDSATEAVV